MNYALLLTLLIVFGLTEALASFPKSYMAVANRSDSSVSLIDTGTGEVFLKIAKKSTGFEFEPMYVSHLKKTGVFVVGDRKNSLLLIFDDKSGQLLDSSALGKGVFHQWAQPEGNTVVIATDGDPGANIVTIERDSKTSVIVKNRRFELSEKFGAGKPHDVVIDRRYFYLTIHDKDIRGADIDRVLKVSLGSLKVVGSHVFSPDVHVGLPQKSPYLLVAEQSGKLNFLVRSSMEIVKQVENLPGAHGLFWNPRGSRIFSANIRSIGDGSLYEIQNTYNGEANLLSTSNSSFSKPHNISVDFANDKLYLTHSGANDTVSLYDTSGTPELLGTITTGANPFGIGLITLE